MPPTLEIHREGIWLAGWSFVSVVGKWEKIGSFELQEDGHYEWREPELPPINVGGSDS
jgi:hypothetical protein